METRFLVIFLGHLSLPNAISIEPYNQLFDVDAGEPTPDLACMVGFHSIDQDFKTRVNCSEAHTIEIPVSYGDRKSLEKKGLWLKKKKTIRFGTQEDNTMWPDPVTSWVCSSEPRAGTVTYNCLPENQAPAWYKTPILGPAPGPYGRKPGCNGGMCYCNNLDFCNQKETDILTTNKADCTRPFLLLPLIVLLLLY